ncbi:hypothetical protein ABTY59_33700 [Streptomyces sp. NPDC096079]|uniref:hypothetical protein n=1 Tax=Streptomyces sp. NPDC096079 TaxID=3155820 RepID=UPI003334045D
MGIPIVTIADPADDLSLACMCGAGPGEECPEDCIEGEAFEDFYDADELDPYEVYGIGAAAYAEDLMDCDF